MAAALNVSDGCVGTAVPEPPLRSEEADADFLDLLGSWENETDRWVDPFRIGEDLLSTVVRNRQRANRA